MTSPAQKVSSACRRRKRLETHLSCSTIVVIYYSYTMWVKDFSNTSNLLGFYEFEMLCFLLQINMMHLKHQCQFSLSRRTTVNASNVGTVKTGLQHSGHISPMGVFRTHRPNTAYHCTMCRGQVDTKDRAAEGAAGSGNAWGALYSWLPGREGRGPSFKSPPPDLHANKWGRKHTQSRQCHTLLTLTHLLIQSVALILCRWQCQ